MKIQSFWMGRHSFWVSLFMASLILWEFQIAKLSAPVLSSSELYYPNVFNPSEKLHSYIFSYSCHVSRFYPDNVFMAYFTQDRSCRPRTHSPSNHLRPQTTNLVISLDILIWTCNVSYLFKILVIKKLNPPCDNHNLSQITLKTKSHANL